MSTRACKAVAGTPRSARRSVRRLIAAYAWRSGVRSETMGRSSQRGCPAVGRRLGMAARCPCAGQARQLAESCAGVAVGEGLVLAPASRCSTSFVTTELAESIDVLPAFRQPRGLQVPWRVHAVARPVQLEPHGAMPASGHKPMQALVEHVCDLPIHCEYRLRVAQARASPLLRGCRACRVG